MKLLRKLLLLIPFILLRFYVAFGQGESSTYFNVFVPPNADPVKRNVCLIVTAIFDDTEFEIIDDNEDGDSDDSKSGILSAGQSYVLYIADNGINDDAKYASGGVLKQDGDYFIVRSNKNMLVSQSTNSDWQHDFVPSVSQKGIGERFIVYAPQISSSRRDLNTFVYEDSTLITIKKISFSPTTVSGYTNINYENAVIIGTKLLNRGQDIIYFNTLGRDVMESGHTYMVEASKPITLQYGALYGNERDGGGNVPSSNGSSSGELFYFGVPYQSVGEQEIRIVSWDNSNSITLERYSSGSWIAVKNWSLNRFGFSDWVGKTNGNVSYPTVFRIKCSPGKRVSIFEANWLETGNPGTSDIGSMLTSENGTSAGTKFIAYIAPPGNEQNVMNPFTGTLFGQRLSHLYIATRTGAHVTIKDAYTNGTDFTKTFDIAAERYADCYITEQEWKNIYNGTGTVAGGPERPYLVVESDKPISVYNTNFNDNWMAYLGTSQVQSFSLSTTAPSSAVIPGDTTAVVTDITLKTLSDVINTSASIQAEGNVQIVSSTLTSNSQILSFGVVNQDGKSVTYNNLPDLSGSQTYSFTTEIVATVSADNGKLFTGNSIGSITASLTGTVDNVPLQAVSSEGIFVNSADQSLLMFTRSEDAVWNNLLTDSWTVNLVDYNNDGWDDIFITEQNKKLPNYLYHNNGDKTFAKVTTGNLVTDQASTVSASWADTDNDGDLDVVIANNTEKPNNLYINDGNGSFTQNNSAGFVQTPAYYHNASWVDYDNDGKLDLYLCNYWPTKFNELWHNEGNNNFTHQKNSVLSLIPGDAVSVSWADYDNDGLLDIFLPTNKPEKKNQLYHNGGNGNFSLVANSIIAQGGGYSVASCWGDVDGNGYLDLFVANASAKNNYLYLNNGNGTFNEVTSSIVVQDGGHSHGCSFADIDNDGDLDLYVANDAGEKFLYLNNGNGTFTKRINEVLTANYGPSMGHAWADLDKDGDLDLFSVTHSNSKNHLFWNNGNDNHWLQLKLTGLKANRSAIGTRIRLKSDGKWQIREVNSQSGIGGQCSYRVHFGLGASTVADSLLIQWPSGITQVLTNVNAGQFLAITEEPGATFQATFFVDKNDNCEKDPDETYLADQQVRITPLNILLVTNSTGTIQANLTPGQFSLELVNNQQYTSNCSGSTISFGITGPGQDISLGNIGLKPSCNCSDANITMSTTALRRGFGNDYVVQIHNSGSLHIENTKVKVTAPVALPFTKATPAWDSQQMNGNNYEYSWNIGTLQSNETKLINIRDSVSLQLQVDDEVQVKGEITGNFLQESNLDNNVLWDINYVVGAIDPNMLTAMPKGYGENHFIEMSQEITYKVYFENFGNHSTSFVTILDTLPVALDPESIYDIQSSHYPVFTSVKDSLLTFYLPDIHLTPAEEDSVLSQGFVQFRVRIKNDAETSGVNNRAAIIFDYNEPIITNETQHTVFYKQKFEAGKLIIFPNPSHNGKTNIIINEAADINVSIVETIILDLRGVVLTSTKAANDQLITLSTEGLENGVYIIQALGNNGKLYSDRIVVLK